MRNIALLSMQLFILSVCVVCGNAYGWHFKSGWVLASGGWAIAAVGTVVDIANGRLNDERLG